MNIQHIANDWSQAWAGKDTDAFVGLFAPGAVYRDDQAGRVSLTPEDLAAFHAHFANALSDIRFEFTTTFQSGENACLEWIFQGTHTGTFHGRPPTGIRIISRGASVLKLTPEGKILTCTDYYDGAALARQLAGEAAK